ncbi:MULTISPECIES: sodium-extruding oxaloacetate decarboxylase subunit alpha [unclassified Legionella]|uniref:sodium-extruding oxaloacetate decarboxylase subunit alpha n=1 Tax=unclassified Legionella TaxID=2622702 RepID=UPI001055BDED|nr:MULTISPECIES: sodium-extruding oxaloacetate decarboxylase subunit alpha [unclassified Legionella]MDI9819272.1 sodium-extruding oxaloacetate decarboxylase subunit alpha [Legionella sp. PL877]
MAATYITDVTLRDAHQCLIATRLRTEDMLPACKKMDQVGFWAMEVWGGATFDACLRFLKEDPWGRLRQLRKALPNTPLSMLLRGQNLLGYRHYADDVVEAFINLAAKNGIDVFRVFDALNDVRNLRTALKAVKANKKHAQGTICYTTSPVHTLKSFVNMGKALADMGCDSIAIKDMAGLLTPQATVELYTALAQATRLPIHLHSHATSGLASMCHYQAVIAGCRHIDTAISSFSGGASHPATESLVAALAGTAFDTGLNLNLLLEIGEYFKEVRKKYQQFESEASETDPRVQLYQVPGGMISNLYSQLKEQQALDKINAVYEEIPRVRKDLGYPPLVTPTSQIVGTQAVMNVLTGVRYQTITNEVKLYCQGKYGAAPGKISSGLRRKAIGQTDIIDVRPADLLPDELTRLSKEIGETAASDEDVLTYAMFPEVGRQFLEQRKNNSLLPEPLITTNISDQGSTLSEFDITLHGESYHVKIAGYGERESNQRACFLWLDGVPEEVVINLEEETMTAVTSRKKPLAAGDITVAMPGTVININVQAGEKVRAGQVLFVLEAMKMETEIHAPFNGTVESIFCQKGDKVTPAQVLMHLAKAGD